MSTYYALVCDTHRVVSGVIGERSLAARWWENSVGVLAAFLAEHADCRPNPVLISEHDERAWQYRDMGDDETAPSSTRSVPDVDDSTRVRWRCRVCAGEAWGPELPLRLESNGRRVVVYEPECWGTETLPHGPVRMRRLDHVDGETNT
jgi:hypothetical protein